MADAYHAMGSSRGNTYPAHFRAVREQVPLFPRISSTFSLLHSVAAAFRTKFAGLADSSDPDLYGSGYEYIPVDVHVPVLPVWEPKEKDSSASLSSAVIQGSFTIHRRDYLGVFADLQQSLAGLFSFSLFTNRLYSILIVALVQ